MEENAVATVTEVTEMQETAVSTLALGEQTAPTETESVQSESSVNSISGTTPETDISENVPVEHPAETSVPTIRK